MKDTSLSMKKTVKRAEYSMMKLPCPGNTYEADVGHIDCVEYLFFRIVTFPPRLLIIHLNLVFIMRII
jgi:hypothetical protein